MGRVIRAIDDARTQSPVTIEVPMPPSVNQIWRARRSARNGKPSFYLDARYATWKRAADNIILATVPRPRIMGHFEVTIVLNAEKRRGDADNRAKAAMDFLQRAGVIENDKLANSVTTVWGFAPTGCRIEVWPSDPPAGYVRRGVERDAA